MSETEQEFLESLAHYLEMGENTIDAARLRVVAKRIAGLERVLINYGEASERKGITMGTDYWDVVGGRESHVESITRSPFNLKGSAKSQRSWSGYA